MTFHVKSYLSLWLMLFLLNSSQMAKKETGKEMSPVKRRSPREKPVRRLDKENCPSPQRSPCRPAGQETEMRNAVTFHIHSLNEGIIVMFLLLFLPIDSPAKSPRKSPVKKSMVTSSFYGQKKPIYLTPLERKALKESLPPPTSVPVIPSPPSQDKKTRKRSVKGGNKQRKIAAGSNKTGKMGFKSSKTSTKSIKLSEPRTRFVSSPSRLVFIFFLWLYFCVVVFIFSSICFTISFPSIPCKPTSTAVATTSALANSTKHPEAKKSITITFSNLKPKPKIFVGAAFFGTGKKPTSMYKKSAPKSSHRPAAVPEKQRAVLPKAQSEKPKQQEQQQSTAMTKQQQKQPAEVQRNFWDCWLLERQMLLVSLFVYTSVMKITWASCIMIYHFTFI